MQQRQINAVTTLVFIVFPSKQLRSRITANTSNTTDNRGLLTATI